MKTLVNSYNLKALLICVVIAMMISCSSDDTINYPVFSSTPGMAILDLPLNNQECEIGDIIDDKAVVTFNWNESADTEKYNLTITNLVTQNVTLTIGLRTNSTNVFLIRGYPYSWKITSRNSSDMVTESEVWKFYLSGEGESNTVPFPATLLSPLSGATVTPSSGNVTLNWQSSDADGDAVTYTVFADTVDGNQEVPESWQDLTEKSIEISVLPNTIYFWHIETSDGVNTSISSTYTFRTDE